MAYLKQPGDLRRYRVRDPNCFAATCLSLRVAIPRPVLRLGLKGAAASSGNVCPCCLHDATCGCPAHTIYDADLAAARWKAGFRSSRC